MARPVPDHGTRSRYLRGCTCDPCRDAHRRYCKTLRLRHTKGPVTVPIDLPRAHLRKLDGKLSLSAIAAAAGVAAGSLRGILDGKQATCSPKMAAAILAVTPDSVPGSHWVTPLGATRRLQALLLLGYAMDDLNARIQAAEGTGPGRHNLYMIVRGERDWITARVDQAIRRLFDGLHMTPRPAATAYEAGAITRARARAERLGYLPALAWDDIDDPNEKPARPAEVSRRREYDPVVVERILGGDWTLAPQATPSERAEVCRRWYDGGRSLPALEGHTGWAVARYFRAADTAA